MKGHDFEGCLCEINLKVQEIRAAGILVDNDKIYSVLMNALPRSDVSVISELRTKKEPTKTQSKFFGLDTRLWLCGKERKKSPRKNNARGVSAGI